MSSSHVDPQLVEKIVHEVKSQGVFDDFRKNTLADVDTKPAYQNLRQRVENTVKKFLADQKWSPETNKYQLRERLRRHINDMGFLDVGVERIVDQVVNPKIGSVFQPRIEEIAYAYLGISPPPQVKIEPPPPPLMHPLPPLPLSGSPLKIETSSLLPTDLEQVSPDSDKGTLRSEFKDDSLSDMDVDEKLDEDDESPPFEPLIKCESPTQSDIKNEPKYDAKINITNEAPKANNQAQLPSPQETDDVSSQIGGASTSGYTLDAGELDSEKEISRSFDAVAPQESQLSQVSSDSRISMGSMSCDKNQSPCLESTAVNISEEAQMPNFNENSSEAHDASQNSTQLHFDIKKDEIKFEGTERKSNILTVNKEQTHFRDQLPSTEGKFDLNLKTEMDTKAETVAEIGNGNSINDSEQISTDGDNSFQYHKSKEKIYQERNSLSAQEKSYGSFQEEMDNGRLSNVGKTLNEPTTSFDKKNSNGNTQSADNNGVPMFVAESLTSQQQGDKSEKETSRHLNLSSTRQKKHSKEKRRLNEKDKGKDRDRDRERDRVREREREREKEKEKDREKDRDRNKDHHRDRARDRDRDRNKERNKDKYREKRKSRSREKSRDELKRSKNSTSSSLKQTSSSDKAAAEKIHKPSETESSITKPRITSSCSSSSTRSDNGSHSDGKRNERWDSRRRSESDKKQKSSNATKKTEEGNNNKSTAAGDDHNESRDKVNRRKSTDSNDDGEYPEGGANTSLTQKSSSATASAAKTKSSKTSNESSTHSSTNGASNGTQMKAECGDLNRSKVVILNDILQNPSTNFIDLEVNSHINHVQVVSSTESKPSTIDAEVHKKVIDAEELLNNASDVSGLVAIGENTPKQNSIETLTTTDDNQDALFYFEEINEQFVTRLRLLDDAMDGCRKVMNSLVAERSDDLFDNIDSDTEVFEACSSGTHDTKTTLLDCIHLSGSNEKIQYGSQLQMPPRKRFKQGGVVQGTDSLSSPTPSELSVNSKENETFGKYVADGPNTRRSQNGKKLNLDNNNKQKQHQQQQRYASEDLYKPRPILSQRSKRRRLDSFI